MKRNSNKIRNSLSGNVLPTTLFQVEIACADNNSFPNKHKINPNL